MANVQILHPDVSPTVGVQSRAELIGEFLSFLKAMRERLKSHRVSNDVADVQRIRDPIEDHYIDDQGKPAMYMQFESALYDDAPAMVTLWQGFAEYQRSDLRLFQRMTKLELEGLTGDRHPRKILDRSPFGVVALIIGSVTIWMSMLKTYSGDDLGNLHLWLEAIRFNWIVGTMWIVGLFVVVWYILKTHRNNCQVAFLSSVSRSLDVYLDDQQD